MYKPNVKKLFKQTHKVLGLIFCIFIAIIGITGALISYSNELSRLEASFIERNKSGEFLSVEETLNRFLEQKPKAKLLVLSHEGENQPLGIRAGYKQEDTDPSDVHTLYNGTLGFYSVSRYDGEILPVLSDKMIRAITMLHISLDFTKNNEIGNQIVGISTIIIILLSITGLYFYIPMLKQNFSKNMKLDIKTKGYRFWYKLHSVMGVYTSIFVLIMCLTGLYGSYEWFRVGLHTLIGYEEPAYVPREEKEFIPKPNDINEIARTFEIAKEHTSKDNVFLLFIPDKMGEPYGTPYKDKDYIGFGGDEIIIDMDTNIIKHNIHYDDSFEEKVLSSMGHLHFGTFFGEIGKALWCVSSLAMGLFGVSGVMMW
ncbi:MAG: PepSY domain-containing protein [Campylobacteraceae bacterium]|jgi:sulfite reductase (NADPH) flavoprotein alpha-component|nr:PepSY domain-containing protein [Campylobacteraceae bacterium]